MDNKPTYDELINGLDAAMAIIEAIENDGEVLIAKSTTEYLYKLIQRARGGV